MKNYKDPAKRKKMLQAADPQIPATRQPPATTAKDESGGASHLYPPINIADLSKDDLALVFVHAQVTTAFHSHVWAVLEHTGLDIYTLATENRINQEYRMAFVQRGGVAHYGTVVNRAQADVFLDLDFTTGLIVLRIHEYIYGFLHRLCEEILATDRDKLVTSGPFVQTVERIENSWPTLSGLSRTEPYKALSAMNFSALINFVDAGLREKILYLAEMRESPAHYLNILRASRKAMLWKPIVSASISSAVPRVNNVVQDAYRSCFFWSYVKILLQRLVDLQNRLKLVDGMRNLTPEAITQFQLLESWMYECTDENKELLRAGLQRAAGSGQSTREQGGAKQQKQYA